jgi:hypothetical protein
VSDRLNADIPILILDDILIHSATHELRSLCNLVAETGRGQDLRQQWIRVKSNRREHLIQFVITKCRYCL